MTISFDEFEAELRKQVGGRLPEGGQYTGPYLKLTPDERLLLQRQGNFLQSQRNRHNRSEEEVARATGVSLDFLILLEEGIVPETDWPTDFVYKYATALGDMNVLREYAGEFDAQKYIRRKLSENQGP